MHRRSFFLAALLLRAAPAAAQPADLFAAIRAQDLAEVRRRLEADPALLGSRDTGGATPLLAAAYQRKGVLFVRPEDNPVYGYVASKVTNPDLFEACVLRRLDAVSAALARDPAAVRSSTANGRTALHYAAYVGDVPIIDALAKAGAAVDAPAAGVFNSPPILQAILGHRQAALERLIALGADVNFRLSDGSTPMHEAALTGQNEMVRALARAGAVPDAVRQDGRRPRDLALAQNHPDTAALLDELTGAGS